MSNGQNGVRAEGPKISAEVNPQTGQISFVWPIDPTTGRINEMFAWLLHKRLGMAMEKAALDGADARPPLITPASGLPMFRPGQHP